MFKLKNILLFSIFVLGFFVITNNFVLAENQIFLENLPGMKNLESEARASFKIDKDGKMVGDGGSAALRTYVNWIIQTSVILGSMLAVGFIIFGGITYMTTDSFSGKTEGKEHLTNAIGGLIFLIGGYLIFLQINPNILNIDFSTASGMVDIEASDIGIFKYNDPDSGNDYSNIRDKLKEMGYTEEVCSSILKDGITEVFTLKSNCEARASKQKQEDGVAVSQCYKWSPAGNLDAGAKYCYSYKPYCESNNMKEVFKGKKDMCEMRRNTYNGQGVTQCLKSGDRYYLCSSKTDEKPPETSERCPIESTAIGPFNDFDSCKYEHDKRREISTVTKACFSENTVGQFFCVTTNNLTEYEREREKYLSNKEKVKNQKYEFKGSSPTNLLNSQYDKLVKDGYKNIEFIQKPLKTQPQENWLWEVWAKK